MLHDIAVVCIYQFKGRVVNVGFKRLEKSLSFFGFAARKAVSATAFTVTGVVNKFLTVAINVTIWDKHASPAGLEDFEEHAAKVKTLKESPSNENLLILYGLYKQATLGPVTTARPGIFSQKDRAKWDA
ncbi:hypothetical protein KIW84_070694 [Lathyrus oleraceus]|uniref:ACB domain-containing protein n=1 Tax=Pisum sativum TaxID=3888 RepID=A0A9D4VGU7_PEA|nr:hypothetical protein KIW84_070694 [Pisum sativum]